MTNDPVENTVQAALDGLGISYRRDVERITAAGRPTRLDFYLDDYDLYIECKRFATARTTHQVNDLTNVIIIQGLPAAEAFAQLLRDTSKATR